MTKCKISPLAFGLSLGVVWGGAVLIMGLLSHFFAYGTAFVTAMGVMMSDNYKYPLALPHEKSYY